MDEKDKAIDLLRMAIASIRHELDEDEPSEEVCWDIAEVALTRTRKFARPKDLTVQTWEDYLNKIKDEYNV